MTSKEYRKYQLINEIIGIDPQGEVVMDLLFQLLPLDASVALDMWEYKLDQHESQLGDVAISRALEGNVFEMFYTSAETKLKQAIMSSTPLVKLVYGCCVTAASGKNLVMLTTLFLATKLTAVEEMFKGLARNPHINYGEAMRAVVDDIFVTYCNKNGVKIPVLNKKQSKLLMTYIAKIKGPNKALLTQRIKELG